MTAIELRAELLREMSPLLDNEVAMKKMLMYVRSLVLEKKTRTDTVSSGWADRFVGAWKDDRTAEEIIHDIHQARTKNNIDVVALDDVKEALSFIRKNTTGKEVLVFKGSQYLEWLVEKLLNNPDDAEKLPRREPVEHDPEGFGA